MRVPRETVRRWPIALAGAALIGLGGLEWTLRGLGFRPPLAGEPSVLWSRMEDRAVWSRDGLHMHDPQALWRPRPGARVMGAERINAAGFRGPLLQREKSPGVLRIALLGDAQAFGLGVQWEHSCAARLSEFLAQRGVRAEVLAAGVVGASLPQGLARWKSAVEPWSPDVVVCAWNGATESLPAVGASDVEKLAQPVEDGSRVARLARWLPSALSGSAWRRLDLELRAEAAQRQAYLEGHARARVSVEEFAAAARELVNLIRARQAQVWAVSPPRAPHDPRGLEFVQALRASGAQWVELPAATDDWFQREAESGALRASLSPAGHAGVAAALAAAIGGGR